MSHSVSNNLKKKLHHMIELNAKYIFITSPPLPLKYENEGSNRTCSLLFFIYGIIFSFCTTV